jgi:hypothetical protein
MLRKLLATIGLALLVVAPANSQQIPFRADSQINVFSKIAANNTTAVPITTNRATVYSIDAFNNGTTIAYVKLYNGAATCGSGTPQARYMIPFGTSSAGGGFNLSNINGDVYVNGITMCITTGIADNDTSAPAASTYIVNVHWDSQGP